MPVGFPTKVNFATGDVLSAQNMNDLSGTVNLLESAQYAAGKNEIINGDFGVWQRGTSFTNLANSGYSCDRFKLSYNGTSVTNTVSRQTFTPGTAPVAGYEGTYFFRYNQTSAGSGQAYNQITQWIEDVQTLAGQVVTFSFWAKTTSGTLSVNTRYIQTFGSGGSAAVEATFGSGSTTITTSWQRITATGTIPSIAGKTIGTSSALIIGLDCLNNITGTIDTWGWQLEAASTASAFQTATGTKQGELAMCQRYLPAVYLASCIGYAYAANSAVYSVNFPVPARVNPTGMTLSGLTNTAFALNVGSTVTPTFNSASSNMAQILVTSGLTITAGQGSRLDAPTILFTGCEL
jgi:hypothetical protein